MDDYDQHIIQDELRKLEVGKTYVISRTAFCEKQQHYKYKIKKKLYFYKGWNFYLANHGGVDYIIIQKNLQRNWVESYNPYADSKEFYDMVYVARDFNGEDRMNNNPAIYFTIGDPCLLLAEVSDQYYFSYSQDYIIDESNFLWYNILKERRNMNKEKMEWQKDFILYNNVDHRKKSIYYDGEHYYTVVNCQYIQVEDLQREDSSWCLRQKER